MTASAPGLTATGLSAGVAVIDGIDVDAVAAVVRGCPGVSGLDGGQYGEVTTYLPGRAVPGVTIGDGRVLVQVRAAWDTEVPRLAAAISGALSAVTRNRPVDVMIADIDDPPAAPPPVTPVSPPRRVRRVAAGPNVPRHDRPGAGPAPR
ncbi:MAG: hypothetical protein ABSA02_10500 [Trebonia sp.]|jgi:hypothetical protein